MCADVGAVVWAAEGGVGRSVKLCVRACACASNMSGKGVVRRELLLPLTPCTNDNIMRMTQWMIKYEW